MSSSISSKPPVLLEAFEVAGLGAVSYTHLRAHETVLDLVCRLLLENKKSQQKHTQINMQIKHNNINSITTHTQEIAYNHVIIACETYT